MLYRWCPPARLHIADQLHRLRLQDLNALSLLLAVGCASLGGFVCFLGGAWLVAFQLWADLRFSLSAFISTTGIGGMQFVCPALSLVVPLHAFFRRPYGPRSSRFSHGQQSIAPLGSDDSALWRNRLFVQIH